LWDTISGKYNSLYIAGMAIEKYTLVFMNLQEKTLLILVASIIAVTLLITVFVSGILLTSYANLEKGYAEKDLRQVLNNVHDDEASLLAIVSDWGPWDDTYNFVNGKEPDYVASNLVPETYANLRVNFIIITNREGKIAYGGSYNATTKTMAPVPVELLTQLRPGNPLMNMSDPHGETTGILMVSGAPVIVASRPILHTDFSGTPQGVVIMGRYLDAGEINRLSIRNQVFLTITPLTDPSLPAEVTKNLQAEPGSEPDFITPVNASFIGGFTLLPDIYGSNAVVLETVQPRDIYNTGMMTTMQLVLIVLGALAFLGVIIVLMVDRSILSRLESLTRQVTTQGYTHDPDRRICLTGDDELTGLAKEINRMLETTEKTHDELVKSNERFRELAELLPQIIFEIDQNGRLTFLNQFGFEKAQIPPAELEQGLDIYNFIAKEDHPRVKANIQRIISGERSAESVYTFVCRDGTTFTGETFTSAILQEASITGFRGIVVDITRQRKLQEILAESQNYLRSIFESLTVGVMLVEAESHKIIDVNPAAAAMIGANKPDIVGQLCYRFICSGEQGHCPITDDKQSFDNAERILITADGHHIPVIKHVTCIRLNGRDCMLETFIDNSERKKMESALIDSTRLLNSILRVSPVGVFQNDREGRIIFVNDRWTQMTGITLDQIRGRYWAEALHPEDRHNVLSGIADSIRGEKEISLESRVIRPDGSVLWLIGQAVPLKDNDGLLIGWVGTITDITERKRIELALAESEDKYRTLAENSSDVLFSVDLKGVITYISPMVNRYGYLAEEIVSQPLDLFIHPADREGVRKNLSRELSGGEPVDSSFRILDKWGYVHWIEEKSMMVIDQNGHTVGVNGVLRDFTDRRRAEDAVVLANKKLNLLNNITRHDILNTITGLLGCVDMANATDVPAEREKLLTQIKELTRVIQRQIAFTREYQSVGITAPAWQNIRGILKRAEVNFSGSGITFVDEIENTEIYADPLLEKVFYNLIDNAIRYGEHIRTIRFYYQISDLGLTLICEDDGIGIPDGEKERIFERGIGRNTGMGLFLTREILLITGITIREAGRPGFGARFEMLIPNGAFRFVREKADEAQNG
jgi:PAS domain S-box-containing protein